MKKGISLIVLVITIIVMIILAASVVITLSNTSVINKANEAVSKSSLKEVEQYASIVWAEEFMNGKRDNKLIEDVLTRLDEYKDLYDIEVNNSGVSVTDKNSSVQLGEVHVKVYKYTSGVYENCEFMEFANSANYVTKEPNAELVIDYGNIGDYDMIYDGWKGPETGHFPWYDRVEAVNGGTIYTPKHDIVLVNIVTPIKPKSTSCWFFKMSNLLEIRGIENIDTSEVKNMSSMFSGCYNLMELDVSGFITEKATNMAYMFAECESLTKLDITRFNTSNVTDMSGMFRNMSYLTEINVSNFDTKNVTDMGGMFLGCEGFTKLVVSNFDTKNVTNMNGMFQNCKNLETLDLSSFNTSKVEDFGYIFAGCCKLVGKLDYSNFDLSNANIYKIEPSCIDEK